MKSFFSKSFRLTFAAAILGELHAPKSLGFGSPGKSGPGRRSVFAEVQGQLPLREHAETGDTAVHVKLYVGDDWMDYSPMAFTEAPFIRQEKDWHIPLPNMLCYCQDLEWSWVASELWQGSAESDVIISTISRYCIRNVDSLITRHLYGHRFGIRKWPKEWDQWSHGNMGAQEFAKFKKKA